MSMMVQVERKKKRNSSLLYHRLIIFFHRRGKISSLLILLVIFVIGLWLLNQLLQNVGILLSSSSSTKNKKINGDVSSLLELPQPSLNNNGTKYWCYLDKPLTGGMYRSSLHMPYAVQWVTNCWSFWYYQNQEKQRVQESIILNTTTTTTSSTTSTSTSTSQVGIALDKVMYKRFISEPNFPNWNRPFFQALNMPILIVDKKKQEQEKQSLFRLKAKKTADKNDKDEDNINKDSYRDLIYNQLVHNTLDVPAASTKKMNAMPIEGGDDGSTDNANVAAVSGVLVPAPTSTTSNNHNNLSKDDLVVYTVKKFGSTEWFQNDYSCITMKQRLWDALHLTSEKLFLSNDNKEEEEEKDDTIIQIGFVERPARRLIVNSTGLAKALQYEYDTNTDNKYNFKVNVTYDIISDEHYTLYDQALFYYTKDIIIMAHGAGTTNVIFMRDGTQLLELFPHNFFFELYKPLVEECNVNHYWYYDYDIPQTVTAKKHKGHYDSHTTGDPKQDFQDHFKQRGRNRNIDIYITFEQLRDQVDIMISKLVQNRKKKKQKQQIQQRRGT